MTGFEGKKKARTGVSGMLCFSLKRMTNPSANIFARAKAAIASAFAPTFAPALA